MQLDPRAGSKELHPYLEGRVPLEVVTLPAGDVAWVGVDEDGRPVTVGVEVKTLGDVLNCIQTKRFADVQLPALQECYEVIHLQIIGLYKCGPSGELLVYRGQGWNTPNQGGRHGHWTYAAFRHWLKTQEVRGGVRLQFASTYKAAAEDLLLDYEWWQLGLGFHKSHSQMSDPLVSRLGFLQPTFIQRMFACLPGLGEEKSSAAEDTLGEALKAWIRAQAWESIPGVGKGIQKKILSGVR